MDHSSLLATNLVLLLYCALKARKQKDKNAAFLLVRVALLLYAYQSSSLLYAYFMVLFSNFILRVLLPLDLES